ncbi:MAG: Repeat domain in Vibrio, Colwellia, Bradyrhizobium and Shewanella [Candidatus Methanoperedenaceae archaeon GB50]|nr:MAG: Repeat domain in Vibrio, Colwellia, Bradyrhizobium and Shewanella [Candidatus Methanoperedenaceae archaeon GB50]
MWQKRSILFIGLMFLLILNGLGKATELILPGSPTCATITDFNGDLNSDLAIGTDGAILVYSGNGDGSFSGPAIVPFSGLPNVIKAADVNGDGRMDLVVSDKKMGRIKFYE